MLNEEQGRQYIDLYRILEYILRLPKYKTEDESKVRLELESVLIDSIIRYDPSKGLPLSKWCFINLAKRAQFRKYRHNNLVVPALREVHLLNEETYIDEREEEINNVDFAQGIIKRINSDPLFPEEERRVFNCYIETYSIKKTSKKLKMGEEKVSRLIRTCFSKIKDIYGTN